MRYFTARLVRHQRLNGDNFLLHFADPQIAAQALPGQFLMIAADVDALSPYPILMRPFSVFGVSPQEGSFSILVKVIGLGTRQMSQFGLGADVPMIGLLGNHFEVDAQKAAVMVAGGVGIAPFYLLAQKLIHGGGPLLLLYGARSRSDLVTMEAFEELGVEVRASTEDGSFGTKGRVTDLLVTYLKDSSNSQILACGPGPMLEAVSRIARQHRVPLQVSVECFMGCGFGVCFGCAVETTEGYRLACQYGPVFDGHKMKWDTSGHV
ncbi:MAG TPA: dihydroorotate dehydrogenase electron transfer subunit [Acidobacteriota bacterium]|jgi:dihydroorotate dehydrogenase electron transfer subunit